MFPGVIILAEAPPGLGTNAFDADAAERVNSEPIDGHWLRLMVKDASGEIDVSLVDTKVARRPAIWVPLDDLAELRLDVALRLVRHLKRRRIDLLPSVLRLTPLQKTRLTQLLQAFDIHQDGGGPRDVAAEVLDSRQATLPSVEWKDSAARRKAKRLIHDSIKLVDGGYLTLLRGGWSG